MTQTNPFTDFVALHKPQVDARIKSVLKSNKPSTQSSYADLYAELAILVERGGKRLRPLLCILAYQGYGGDKSAIIDVAVSQEFLHAFLLTHDDIIDRDNERWGGPNILGVYLQKYRQTVPASRVRQLAEAQALLAGDTYFTLANQLLMANDFSSEFNQAALKLQQSIVQEVIAGEVADMSFSHAQSVSETDILQMYQQKTASYSFKLPLLLGAHYAGVDAAEQQRLQDLSNHLGIAFQLQDDLLGMFGNPLNMGKSNLSDLREGKRTLLITKTQELSRPADNKELHALLGNPSANKAALARAQEIIIACGAKDYVQQLMENHSQQATGQISQLALNDSAKDILITLTQKLRSRNH